MQKPRQVRVLRNVLIILVLSSLFLWLNRSTLLGGAITRELWEPFLWSVGTGTLLGLWYFFRLLYRMERKDRRLEKNKIFVDYLSFVDFLLNLVLFNQYFFIPLGVVLILAISFDALTLHFSTLFLAICFGSWAVVALLCVVVFEMLYGPMYLQYQNKGWSGSKGMIYKQGTVKKSLNPKGKVEIGGELWNAISVTGETIDEGKDIEVISIDRLTLSVDEIPT